MGSHKIRIRVKINVFRHQVKGEQIMEKKSLTLSAPTLEFWPLSFDRKMLQVLQGTKQTT